MPRETTHSAECHRWHPGCAYERGRADERQRLSDELLSIAGDPDVMSRWLNAHGVSGVSGTNAARVMAAYAGELDARLGAHTGRTGDTVPRCRHTSPTPWGPSQCALPDGHDQPHAYSPSEALEDMTGDDDG